MTTPDVYVVDELCRVAMVARRLGCGVHLTGVDPDLRSLLDLAGVADLLCECPAGEFAHDPADSRADLR